MKLELNSNWTDNFSTKILISDTDVGNPNTPVGATTIGEVGIRVASGGTVFLDLINTGMLTRLKQIESNMKSLVIMILEIMH